MLVGVLSGEPLNEADSPASPITVAVLSPGRSAKQPNQATCCRHSRREPIHSSSPAPPGLRDSGGGGELDGGVLPLGQQAVQHAEVRSAEIDVRCPHALRTAVGVDVPGVAFGRVEIAGVGGPQLGLFDSEGSAVRGGKAGGPPISVEADCRSSLSNCQQIPADSATQIGHQPVGGNRPALYRAMRSSLACCNNVAVKNIRSACRNFVRALWRSATCSSTRRDRAGPISARSSRTNAAPDAVGTEAAARYGSAAELTNQSSSSEFAIPTCTPACGMNHGVL